MTLCDFVQEEWQNHLLLHRSKQAFKSYNENVNVNVRSSSHRPQKRREKHHSAASSKKPNKTFGIIEEPSTDCASGRRKNQWYTSSFANSTDNLSVDQELDKLVGNNSKAKTLTSVHEGEDMTLCWIETTTIKEDKNVRPPKRLVIREYTISFENSATIPDRYLECKRFEGELSTNDHEIGKTALFEIIDENTQVSKVVNFTSVSHEGNITDWQYKTVKCGVGPVVTKNIVEYTSLDNPKKRVEIKVSPKINLLTVKSDEEPCTDSSEENTDKSTESCENGSCGMTTMFNEVPTKSQEIGSTEKTVSESEGSEEILKLSTGVTKKLSSEEEPIKTTVTPEISTKISEKSSNCDENPLDPECLKQTVVKSSLEELFTESSVELSTTEAAEKSETSTSKQIIIPNLKDQDISTKEEISKELSISEEDKSISDIFTTGIPDISIESSESATIQPTSAEYTTISKSFDYYDHIATTLKPTVTTSTLRREEVEKKRATSEEHNEELLSPESTRKELDVADNVLSSHEISTAPYTTTTIPSTEHSTKTVISASKEEEEEEEEEEESKEIVISESKETTEQSTEFIISASKEEGSEEIVTSESEETTEQSTEEFIISASKEKESEEIIISESKEIKENVTLSSIEERSKEVVTSESKETTGSTISTFEEEESEEVTSESGETIEQSTEIIISESKEKKTEEVATSESKETTESVTSTSEEEESEEITTSESEETIEQSTEIVISASKEKENEEVISYESKETIEQSVESVTSTSEEEGSENVVISKETAKSITSMSEESDEIITSESEDTIEQSTETVEISASKEKESKEVVTSESEETTEKVIGKDKLTAVSLTSSEGESCENSEDCVSSSEACLESEDCGSTTKKSCESETCSEEKEEIITDESKSDSSSIISESSEEISGIEHTTVASIADTTIIKKEDNISKNENIPTTVETRRSTLPYQKHKLNLKIKILLEHIDEKEKHNLVEVEKHLSLYEDIEHHDHTDLVEQLKSLNDSVNLEALNALLNCTTLNNLTNDPHISKILNNSYEETFEESNPSSEATSRRRRSLEEIKDAIKDLVSTSRDNDSTKKEQLSTTTNSNADKTTIAVYLANDANFTTSTNIFEEESNDTINPAKNDTNFATTYNSEEETTDTLNSTQETYLSTTTNSFEKETTDSVNIENVTFNTENKSAVLPEETSKDKTKLSIVRRALLKLREDISTGFQHIISQLQSNLTLVNDENKTDKTDLLDIISDPKDDRITSRKRREIAEKQLGHWSNERIGEAPIGSKLRSFTEFTLYKSLF
ncbi:FK506-binding protein 5-like [Pseudomyrmex gracilis]|uniref:FK506-binding protein 5-like n=1 Tax=Pseudomyrmex gracilis TaxID=219809 RepID=UPI000995974D|nr:FK506-binding protein 5-like [Pseudomyrmex gracilis]